jgi:uncharacterized protein YdhG (YjbR/CyaY superfamily)
MATKPTNAAEYLVTVPDDARATLEELRRMIKAVAPDAVEVFGYGMPGFKYLGKTLIYFGAWTNHSAIYGMNVEGHQDELAAYDTAKGTIRFPLGEPLPEALVKILVCERISAIEAKAAGCKRR